MDQGERYQIALTALGILVTVLFSLFFLRELFPEYRVYQDAYVALEAFNAKQKGDLPPPFQKGIKQIVIEADDRGPPVIDRCISCHVALDSPIFSPTRLLTDEEGEIVRDEEGVPVQVPNEEYIWDRVDGPLAGLKEVKVRGQIYDMTKVLKAHPLIGRETRPFEFHPVQEMGCTSCHGGNGHGLVTDRAHGPLFDGEYAISFMGPKPQFLESDPEKDPRFSRLFNDKPGARLLFQTTPLLVGDLIQSRCVECHQPVEITPFADDYIWGQSLFLSQACYGCHRIEGFARGGVGPPLTDAAELYPWYLKESIVWPRGNLETSDMPNFHLDHEEVEDLMTFLMAQHGRSKKESEVAYKRRISAWEGGKKQPWESPIPPSKRRDLPFALNIFAKEGCAACHRLHGFEPESRAWFRALVPEEVTGRELIALLEERGDEIGQRLKEEPLFPDEPGLVEAFYAPFKFAKRAHKDPVWKERVDQLLTAYVKEYGLGRLIGPRPNWSGIYRSDQWLIEHFRKPSLHVPRSIMPAFPFDEGKFFSLTQMLNQVGATNRDLLREQWKEKGFDPKQVYQQLCSQCHGTFLRGDGPVAEMLYPLPKNLRSAPFLRQLTKERAVHSVLHGVKGTPMPPWGEVGDDKGPPILTREEAAKLVDWIFATTLGTEPEKPQPKWQYSAEDVVRELKDEGDWPGSGALFDRRPNPLSGPEENLYSIKKKYATEANIRAGEKFFEVNCAACHGKQADGMGARAAAMSQAKPRMLTNLDWGETRDDLRLLRSIKFGVAGTAMTPWGDLTTSLQRIQLVLFIRSLHEDKRLQEKLSNSLYDVFDRAKQAVGDAEASGMDYTDLDEALSQEEKLYRKMGEDLIPYGETLFDPFIDMIKAGDQRFHFLGGRLERSQPVDEEKIAALGQDLLEKINGEISDIDREKEGLLGKLPSHKRREALENLEEARGGLIRLKEAVAKTIEETAHIRKEQEIR